MAHRDGLAHHLLDLECELLPLDPLEEDFWLERPDVLDPLLVPLREDPLELEWLPLVDDPEAPEEVCTLPDLEPDAEPEE